MPFCKELATATGSSYVRDMMIVRFQREVSLIFVDEGELKKKAQEIRYRVAERDLVIGELELLFEFDSRVQSVLELNRLQTEDLSTVSSILVNVMKKQKKAEELFDFIEKLKAMVY